MVSLVVLFWMFIILFASIGSMRGWARELLVTFSAILALFILTVLYSYVPFIRNLETTNPATLFWMRASLIISLAFFGYQTPNIPRLAQQNRFARDRLQDILLGIVLGALNGWLIVGSIWYFMDLAGYPLDRIIEQPQPGTDIYTLTQQMMPYMPPALLSSSAIYFAIALAFAFVLVVFL
ncbi:MAG: hypothetical protein EHM21_05395 [Chloroflexi bacterium]|nr:MAG: hypothetical protein EHM21_05395 [Chloroflexota bacterium]